MSKGATYEELKQRIRNQEQAEAECKHARDLLNDEVEGLKAVMDLYGGGQTRE